MPNRSRHLLAIDDLTPTDICALWRSAAAILDRQQKKHAAATLLAGMTVILAFFEPSTRTSASFELAAKRLGATVLALNLAASSQRKGETDADTVLTLDAMQADVMVVRHTSEFLPARLARRTAATMINAGDGCNEHPTQALTDGLVILHHKDHLHGLTVAIVGDSRHSRVARSNVRLLRQFGAEVRLVGPAEWLPESWGVPCETTLHTGLTGADVVMVLRPQWERHDAAFARDRYIQEYRVDAAALSRARPEALVMHPGPVTQDIELTAEVMANSAIQTQVQFGVALRMAVLQRACGLTLS